MKITTARLKQIIKEEIDSSLEDLEARMAAMDTRRDDDTKKVKHRGARDELNEIARTLQQMFDLSNAVAQKKSEHFQNTTVYGLSIREQPALKELADIVREYAKHVKDAEAEPMSEGRGSEYSENLRYTNDRVDHIIKKVNELSDEMVHGSTRGGPYERMPVDMYIDGFDNYDEPRKVLRDQAEKLNMAIEYGLDRPIPQIIRDKLRNEVKSGFLSRMHGLKSRYEENLQRVIAEELEAVLKKAPKKKDHHGETCAQAHPEQEHEEWEANISEVSSEKQRRWACAQKDKPASSRKKSLSAAEAEEMCKSQVEEK